MSSVTTAIAASGTISVSSSAGVADIIPSETVNPNTSRIPLSSLFKAYGSTVAYFDAQIHTNDGSYISGPDGTPYGYNVLTPDIPIGRLSQTYLIPSGSANEATLVAFNADQLDGSFSEPAVSIVLGNNVIQGIDVPINVTGISRSIENAGFSFVIRYYHNDVSTLQDLTATEIQDLERANLQIVPVWENQTQQGYSFFTSAQGQSDALAAIAEASSSNVRQPAGSAIYFAADLNNFDRNTGIDHIAAFEAYFQAIRAVFNTPADNPNGYLVGVYGSGEVDHTLQIADHYVDFTWLNDASYSWAQTGEGPNTFQDWQLAQVAVTTERGGIDSNLDPSGKVNPGGPNPSDPTHPYPPGQILLVDPTTGSTVFHGIDVDVARAGVSFGSFGNAGSQPGASFSVSFLGTSVVEGNPANFLIRILNPQYGITPDYRITFRTINGTALSGSDYQASGGFRDFTNLSQQQYVISINTIDSTFVNGQTNFYLQILDNNGSPLGDNQPHEAAAIITDFNPLSGNFQLAQATEGIGLPANSTNIAFFSDVNGVTAASGYSATIDWGDGTPTTAGTVIGSAGSFTVFGGHTYGDEGPFLSNIIIARIGDGAQLQLTGVVAVAEGDVFTANPATFSTTTGQSFNGTVATFSDADTQTPASDLLANINWGDGTAATPGTVSGSSGLFTVSGAHTYATAGQRAVSVTLSEQSPGIAAGTALSTATVNGVVPPPDVFFAPGQPINLVQSSTGANLPAPVPGQFNLELITNATGTGSYTTVPGYQGVAVVSADNHTLTLLHGNYGVVDVGGNQAVIAGDGSVSVGGASSDVILGGSGASQFLDGHLGNQSVIGGSGGNETIWGAATDTVRGGSGGNETIGGVPGETIFGSSGANVFINVTGGNQSVLGGNAGNDSIWTAAGDTIYGGSNNATVGGVAGVTMIGGSGGNQFLDASQGHQSVLGGSGGNETIWGAAADTIRGGSDGNETIGGVAGETIFGGSGANIFVNATGGSQSIVGGTAGNVTVWAGPGDTIRGGSDNETIGGVPNDTVIGGSSGNTFIDGSQGHQSILGGSGGNETIWGAVSDTIAGDSGGNETIGGVAFETILGGAANTFINATAGSESIVAGTGNTTVWGGAHDTVQGTSGGGSALIGFAGGNETFWDDGATAGRHDSVSTFNQSAGDRVSLNATTDPITNVLATAVTSGNSTTVTLHDASTITLIGITGINSNLFTTH